VSQPTNALVSRNLERVITDRLTEEPVVVLNGARTVGKSTLMRACAVGAGVPVLDLDDMPTRQAVASDPTLFVRRSQEPVCIDEFQHVLDVLDAIKAELNRDLRPGRYLLTGSTRYATLPVASQSLTGRAHVITVWPLSQGELRGHREDFLDRLVTAPALLVSATESTTTRGDYERMALLGGFPLAVQRASDTARARWFRDFVNMVVDRDVLEIRKVRQRSVLPLILRRLAAQTAQVLNVANIASALEMDKNTVGDFVELLEAVFLVHRLGAFGPTLSSRVNSSPKVHVIDSGLAGYLLGVSRHRLEARAPTTLTEFGHILETFAVNEVLKQAGWADTPMRFSHFRTRDGHEVDLVCETDDGRFAGVEVKSASSVPDDEFRGLRMLRDRLGSDFVGGVVLYLGQRSYTKEDRLHVLPLDSIWA
jgi:uncharacterized protein